MEKRTNWREIYHIFEGQNCRFCGIPISVEGKSERCKIRFDHEFRADAITRAAVASEKERIEEDESKEKSRHQEVMSQLHRTEMQLEAILKALACSSKQGQPSIYSPNPQLSAIDEKLKSIRAMKVLEMQGKLRAIGEDWRDNLSVG